MQVLITGAKGFLGSTLLDRLLSREQKGLRCLVRPSSPVFRIDEVCRRHPPSGVERVIGTLSSRADAERVTEGAELIYHCAGAMRGCAATVFADTVVASKHLLEAISRRKPPRIVLISSMSVYGFSVLRYDSVVAETTPLETHPEKRDPYTHAKLRQEQLFREYQQKFGFELIIVRPGIIYGPGGSPISGRVGLSFGPLFLHLGGNNPLPLSYVENAAEAAVVAGSNGGSAGNVYNVVDDGIVTARQYLRAYRKTAKIRSLSLPWPVTVGLSWLCEKSHDWSRGRTPAVLTRYKSACAWRPYRYSNQKLKSLGWKQLVSAEEGMRRLLESLGA
jgi:nucleoside-diphosphate-sugar epimerase